MLEVCLPLLLLFLANAEAESSSSSSGCTELDVDFWQSPWIGKPEIEQVAPNEVKGGVKSFVGVFNRPVGEIGTHY